MDGERDDLPFDARAFPAESEWLALPPPVVGGDFVERALARLRQEGLLREAQPAAADGEGAGDGDDVTGGDGAGDPDAVPGLPAELLAAHAPPPPSPAFVDRTLQRLQQDRAARFRALLLRYAAPQPTPDFVRRTLQALHDGAGRRTQRRRAVLPLLAMAAAVLLAVLLLPARRPDPLGDLAAAAPRAAAYAHSPAVLAHLLAAGEGDDARLPPPDGASLWLLAEGAR